MASSFIERRTWLRVGQSDPAVADDLVEALWRDPEGVLRSGELLRRNGARTTVRFDWAGETFVLKHYREPSRRHWLKQTVQVARARRTWLTAQRLAACGILTPRPAMCLENRFGLLRGDSYLAYRHVPGKTLQESLGDDFGGDRQLSNSIRLQLVALWRRLMELRASLDDMNPLNFIVGHDGRMWTIDVDKARFHWFPGRAQKYYRRGWERLLHGARIAGPSAQQWMQRVRQEVTDTAAEPAIMRPRYMARANAPAESTPCAPEG